MHSNQICPAYDGFCEDNISEFPSLNLPNLSKFAQHEGDFCDLTEYSIFLFKFRDLQLLPSNCVSLISLITQRIYSHFLDFAQRPACKKNLTFCKDGDFYLIKVPLKDV